MANQKFMPNLAKRLVNMGKVLTKSLAEIKAVARPTLKALGVPNRWARAYLRCLSYKREGVSRASLTFDSEKGTKADRFFANVVENGVRKGGIDMKPWFLQRGPTNIPIIHTRKSIKGMTPDKAGSLSAVVRTLTGMGPGERAPSQMVHKLIPKQHKHDPLAAAIRQQQSFVNKAGQKRGRAGSATSFRRLSPTPPENASGDELRRWKKSWYWMREGYQGKKVMKTLGPLFAEIVRKNLAEHLGG